MKKYIITYREVITEEDIKEMTDGGELDDYLWECLRPEGNDWKVEEVDETDE